MGPAFTKACEDFQFNQVRCLYHLRRKVGEASTEIGALNTRFKQETEHPLTHVFESEEHLNHEME